MDLVLLPDVDDPVTAYTETLQSAFQSILVSTASRHHDAAQRLQRVDVAVVLRTDALGPQSNRSRSFPKFSSRVKKSYEAILAGGKDVSLDLPGGIDARVFLLDISPTEDAEGTIGSQFISGPLIDLHTFVNAKRDYNTVYVPQSEDGFQALQVLINLTGSKHPTRSWNIQKLPSAPSMTVQTSKGTDISTHSESSVHYSIASGGTFDHFHIGHKLLLSGIVFLPQTPTPTSPPQQRDIVVGTTGPDLLKSKSNGHLLESWSTRQKRTEDFVESILVFHPDPSSIKSTVEVNDPGPNGHVVRVTYSVPPSTSKTTDTAVNSVTFHYAELSDPYGPTIADPNITGIVVSHETLSGGDAINKKRTEKGWNPLEIFQVDVLNPGGAASTEEDAKQKWKGKISSTAIRKRLAETTSAAEGVSG